MRFLDLLKLPSIIVKEDDDEESFAFQIKTNPESRLGVLQTPCESLFLLNKDSPYTQHVPIPARTSPKTPPSVREKVCHPQQHITLSLALAIQRPYLSQGTPLTMDPLNWPNGVRANRPFQHNASRPAWLHDHDRPTLPPRRPALLHQTEYFQEQVELGRQSPYYPCIPAQPQQGIIKILLISLVKVLLGLLAAIVIIPAYESILLIVATLFKTCRIITSVIFRTIQALYTLSQELQVSVKRIQWDMLLILLLASQVAKWLPGLEGMDVAEEVVIWNQDMPLYVIGMPAGTAFGTGPVL